MTVLIFSSSTKYLHAARANEALIFKRSTKPEGVTTFIFGTSANNLAQPSSSNNTLEFNFSFCLPLLHCKIINRRKLNQYQIKMDIKIRMSLNKLIK